MRQPLLTLSWFMSICLGFVFAIGAFEPRLSEYELLLVGLRIVVGVCLGSFLIPVACNFLSAVNFSLRLSHLPSMVFIMIGNSIFYVGWILFFYAGQPQLNTYLALVLISFGWLTPMWLYLLPKTFRTGKSL